MYIDGLLIEARYLVNGVNILQPDDTDAVQYIHIELSTHDVIMAEGAWSETFLDDDSRGVFHNAQEYRLLYPGEQSAPIRFCAPRPDSGYEVEEVRRKIAQRAGGQPAPRSREQPTLRGYVDRIGPQVIEGWAQNVEYPEAPVCLDIYAGGQPIGRTLANSYREDLRRVGFGSGNHGFEFRLPPGLVVLPNTVEVRRSLDGTKLTDRRQPKRGLVA
jgi:hypothetical protein